MNDSLWTTEKHFLEALTFMEQVGILVDRKVARRENSLGEETMASIANTLGANPSSPKDLSRLLLEELGLPVVKTSSKTGKPSFDKGAMNEYALMLERNQDPTAQQILTYRGWQKSCTTYFKAFLEKANSDGRVRTNLHTHRTVTSRLSSSEPNFQNIPKTRDDSRRWNKYTKQCLVPSQGWGLWEFDYANLELRLGAAYSKQQNLIDAFNRGDDIWQFMKDLAGFDSKELVKTFTYATAYGAGLAKLAAQMGVDEDYAKELKTRYFEAFPNFYEYGTADKDWKTKQFKGKAAATAAKQGYITYWTGRRRHFQYEDEYRKAWNSYLQGGAAEIVKKSIVGLDRKVCDYNCRMVLTVHDSILLEIRQGYEEEYFPKIRNIMEDVPDEFGIRFPVDAHVWGE